MKSLQRKKGKPFAKKSLGQNFLNNPLVREDILAAAGDLRNKNVLEIGPGLGFLTTKLISAGAQVTAIELDERAMKVLQSDFGQMKNVHLIHGDIIEQDLDKLFSDTLYQIVANIPYNITSRLLRKILAETNHKPTTAILMIQKEVAKKLCAKKNSILKLSVEIFAQPEILFEVPRECFSPVPRVDSAVIKLTIYPRPFIPKEDQKVFFEAIHAGFSEKRKKLGNFFGQFFGVNASDLLGDIDPDRRAETLGLYEWIEVAKNLKRVLTGTV